jgi:hypothetical protein
MKVEDPKKRRRLAAQVASGELSLVKLKLKIEGRRGRSGELGDEGDPEGHLPDAKTPVAKAPTKGVDKDVDQSEDLADAAGSAWSGVRPIAPLREDSLLEAKQGLADSLEELFGVLRQKDVLESIGDVDRANLAKYLMIAKLRLENAIALVRSGAG